MSEDRNAEKRRAGQCQDNKRVSRSQVPRKSRSIPLTPELERLVDMATD